MNNTTHKIMTAFINGESLTVSNSTTDGHTIKLFGNIIAKRENCHVYITDAGWKSNTTKERLNGLLELIYVNKRITQKKGEWFLDGEPMDDLADDNGFIEVK